MALIKCSECQNEISDKAAACPNCGTPVNTKSTTGYFTGLNPTNDADVIITSAKWFGENKNKEAIPSLLPLLDDSRESVRFSVIMALQKILNAPQATIDTVRQLAVLELQHKGITNNENVSTGDTASIIESSQKNKVGNKISQIGDIVFTIGFLIALLIITISIYLISLSNLLATIAAPLLVNAVLIIIGTYVAKTLLNGFGENIQILHDIRNDIRRNNDTEK